jgi:xylan 1,4-beta-xylosidase
MHKEIELVFVLKGTVTYEVKNKRQKLMERDLFWVNSFDMHSVIPETGENILLVLQLDPLYFNQFCPDFSEYYFDPLSMNNKSLQEKISTNLAKIMLSLIKLHTGYKLEAVHYAIEIALTLVQYCRTGLRFQGDSYMYKEHRISELIKYIDENYATKIGLDTLSKVMMISPRYISKFFKDNLGIGFVDYVNKLRVTKSISDLLGGKNNILDIAIEHGFNDHKAYNRIFKKEFGMTATEYRTLFTNSPITEDEYTKDDYFSDSSNDYSKYLFEFLQKEQSGVSHDSNMTSKLNINADLTTFTDKKLIKYWKKITSIERASLCLRSDIQSQIKAVQKELEYEYIRFHDIFSDELLVYREDPSGKPVYNWYYIDQIFDFFYEVNLRPFIEIGFMPEALASKKQYTAYDWRANVSYPKSIKKWANLVSEFINHCMTRYGRAEVEKWYFEIWGAPELTNIFWYESKESFFEFYKATYFAIKNQSEMLKVGSPGVIPINNFEWFVDFLTYCESHSITLNFVACHIFSMADPQNKTVPQVILSNEKLNLTKSDENHLQDSVLAMKEILTSSGLDDLDIFVTEWNLSPYNADYTRDTCFLGSYIAHNMLRNIEHINGLAFLSLSDIMDQGITENGIFHGGTGLMTRNNIKKPAYNAFYLLKKLGNHLVEKGENYVITSNGENWQILLYNFVYFDELFRTGDKSLLSYHDRYNIFTSASTIEANIVLNLEKGQYKIVRHQLNRKSGSSFDAWLTMGAPEELDKEMYTYLKSKEIPEISISMKNVKGQMILNETLPAHGILLIEISKGN